MKMILRVNLFDGMTICIVVVWPQCQDFAFTKMIIMFF